MPAHRRIKTDRKDAAREEPESYAVSPSRINSTNRLFLDAILVNQ
jgi:hypothetical protein